MIITYNLKPFFKKDLGSFSKSYLKLKLWVVKLLKLNIEKPWFDYQDTRCCNLAILNVLPKLLPGPNLHFRFMKNSVHTSLLWALVIIHVTKIVVYIKEPTGGPCQPTVASLVYMPKLVSSFHSSRTSCLIAPPYCDSKSFIKSGEIWCLYTVNFDQKSSKLNCRPVHCSWL